MKEVSLSVGDKTRITLPGLGSAGYQWFFEIENKTIASVAKLESDAVDSPRPGASSRDELFEVTAFAAGETIIHFTQKRAFTPAAAPNTTQDIKVVVG
ncbi:MAG TPA: protease inhibitor I42 family protein [Rickettsiales bacterium]|nr:protease inhibitor I42 family protein [Rickettsiales bacterium]